MKKIEMRQASRLLSEVARRAKIDPIVAVMDGRPVAADILVLSADMETVSLSTNRKFLAIIERSRSRRKKEGSISSKEIRRRLGLNK